MKVKFFFFMVLGMMVLNFPLPVLAVEDLAQRWVCLNAVLCSDGNSGCSGTNAPHRARLSVKPDAKPLPDSISYVFECLPTSPTSQLCTTGDAATDAEVLGAAAGSNLTTLRSAIRYENRGLFTSPGNQSVDRKTIRSNSAGIIGPFEMESFTPGQVPRKFMVMNKYRAVDNASGNAGGQQQGTFNFETASRNCVSIQWDPYGRIFDSQSLEPIPDATVTLLRKEGTSYTQPIIDGVTNPQVTQPNGEFSFVVPDGIYKLQVTREGYTFPNTATKLSPYIARAYSDIYRGEDIIQQGKLEHRDIPLDSATPGGNQYEVKVHSFVTLDRLSNKLVIDGTTSHPFTVIRARTVKFDPTDIEKKAPKPGRVIPSVRADKDGKFKLEVDQNNFEAGEYVGELSWTKTNLTGATFSQKIFDRIIGWLKDQFTVEAQETISANIEPIPNYIEGYAYDTSGKTLAHATVGVYLTFADSPYYQTNADEKGYFKIGSENLPFMPYKLRYTTASGARVDTATSKFLAQNVSYLAANKITLNTYKDTQGNTTPLQGNSKTSISPTSSFPVAQNKIGENPSGSRNTQQVPPSTQSGMLLLMVIILVLFGVTGILVGFYLYSKNRSISQM